MKLTALEIRKHEFSRAFRGYDAEEVDAFLNMVAQHWQTTSQDMDRLRERLEEQTERVNHYMKVEEALQSALQNAQSLSDEKLAAATSEAEERVSRAKGEAESALSDADRVATERVEAAEEKAASTMRDAQNTAASTLEAAEEKANRVLADARRQLEELTALADSAREVARQELDRVESERQRILASFRSLMDQGLMAVDSYSAAEPPPELGDFERARSFSPTASLDPVELERPVVAPDPRPDVAPVAVLPDEPADHTDDGLEADSEDDSEADAGGNGRDTTPVLSLSDDANDDYLMGLPSADDVVDDSGSPAAAPAEATPKAEEPFGAKDEIKKIRRILEDLDN